jgi:hypothetical protein
LAAVFRGHKAATERTTNRAMNAVDFIASEFLQKLTKETKKNPTTFMKESFFHAL